VTISTAEPWIRQPLRGLRPYTPPARSGGSDLLLDLNEGAPLSPQDWLDRAFARISPDTLRRYPDASPLEARLAARLGVSRECVLVTNGGDDAIDRVCRSCLGPGDEIVLPSPTFEMIARSAELPGGVCVRVPWPGAEFPLEPVLAAMTDRTRLIAVVSPNNPSGATITADQLRALSAAAPDRLLMVDLAYTEFADKDLTPLALGLPNAVVIRTLSKAYGMAALRVGYAVGQPGTINALRAAGGPFPCSSFSLAAADAALDLPEGVLSARVARIREERSALTALLAARGVQVTPSQANFVLARLSDPDPLLAALADRGIRVKCFATPELADALRIGLPGDPTDFARLTSALTEILDAGASQ